MNFKGVIRHLADVNQGLTKAGNQWKKRTIVIEQYDVQHPQSIVVDVWDDDALRDWKVGQKVEVHLSFRYSEFGGRYYNDVRAWKIVLIE